MQQVIINNLSVNYGNNSVIDTFSFQLSKPTFVAIIGNNGSGKSSFLKAISNKTPYSGSVEINPIKFSYLDQKNEINFTIQVKEMLLMGRFTHKHFTEPYTKQDEEIALSYLDKLDLSHLWNKSFNELSGGEQQMLWIVQVLIQAQPILLLDEPTQQLDLKNKKKIFNLLSQLVEEEKRTVFCVTHDIYNLKNLNGLLINFTQNNPEPEPITESSIQKHLSIIENS